MRIITTALGLLAAIALAGCNDSPVTWAPKPPIAIIHGASNYSPLDVATFDGSDSYVPDGTLVGWDWEIVDRPDGSTAEPAPHAGDPKKVDFAVDVAGDYTIRLTVTDARGMTGSTDFPFAAVPWQTVHVELTWDTAGTDLDLHMVSDTEGGTFFQKPFDCYFDNTNPDWGDAGILADDPSIDRDDVDGYGPEVVSLEQPLDGHTYHLYVHVYDDHGLGSSNATVRVYLNGELRYEAVQPMAGVGDGWDVATIEWPEGKVVPINSEFQFLAP